MAAPFSTYTNEQEDLQRTRKAATHGQPINIPVVSLSGGGWYPERKPDTSSEKKKLAESAVAPPWGVIGGMLNDHIVNAPKLINGDLGRTTVSALGNHTMSSASTATSEARRIAHAAKDKNLVGGGVFTKGPPNAGLPGWAN